LRITFIFSRSQYSLDFSAIFYQEKKQEKQLDIRTLAYIEVWPPRPADRVATAALYFQPPTRYFN
jgi:hypothetical protein